MRYRKFLTKSWDDTVVFKIYNDLLNIELQSEYLTERVVDSALEKLNSISSYTEDNCLQCFVDKKGISQTYNLATTKKKRKED